GIIHHDLKPANVLASNGQVKVLDFGISVMSEHASGSDVAAGTLPYMAPEMLTKAVVSETTDLYALGVRASELFSGRKPFAFDSISTLIDHIMSVTPDFSIEGIDPRMTPVLMRLLAKAPQDRFADATQVISAIGKAIDQPLLSENAATRESFLQAARLVGRDSELAELSEMLTQATPEHATPILW